MNQEFKNIDDLFQSAFADDSAEVPAFVKANIDKRLESKKSKGAWIWFSGLALLILLSASLFWIFNPSSTILTETTNGSTNPDSKTLVSANNTTSENSSVIASNPSEQNELMNDNQAAVTNANLSSDNSKNSGVDNTGLVESKSTETTSEFDNSNSESDLTHTKSSEQKEKITTTGSTTKHKESGATTGFGGTVNPDGNILMKPLSMRMFEKQVSGKNVSPVTSSFRTLNPQPALTPSGNRTSDVATIDAGEFYNPWMFSATGGMNFSQSKYTSTIPSEETLYNDSGNDKPGFEGNIDVRYRLKNSLTFGTGVALSQLKENYDFFKQTNSLDSTLVWSYQDIYEYDSLLDSTIWVGVDSTSTVNYDTTAVTLYDVSGTNTATYLHIPFSVGTQIIRNKFRFDFYVMGRFNYLLNASGGYVENDAFKTFSNTNQIYKPWYFDVMLGTAVHYQLFEKLYLTGTFRYRPQIGNLYQGLSFNRAFQSYHIGIGISLKL